MSLVIKKTKEKDTALNIAKKLPRSFDKIGLNLMRKDLVSGVLYGAYLDEIMIGFVHYKEINPEVIELKWMAVLPNYQGKGTGSKLLTESLKNFKKKYKICEVKTLSEVVSDPGYERTRKFYKNQGFIPLETIYPYPGWSKDSPCQIFVKVL